MFLIQYCVQAMESCQKEGGWLAEVYSREEQEFVVNMAKVILGMASSYTDLLKIFWGAF